MSKSGKKLSVRIGRFSQNGSHIYNALLKKKCHGVKQNEKICALVKQNVMKFEDFILGGQRIDQKRKKGWWRGSREKIEKGSREGIEIERKETKDN